jgi:hypothetical protein
VAQDHRLLARVEAGEDGAQVARTADAALSSLRAQVIRVPICESTSSSMPEGR